MRYCMGRSWYMAGNMVAVIRSQLHPRHCWRALQSTKHLACPFQKHQHHEIQRKDPGIVTSCCCLVANSCPTLCNPWDCSPPDFFVHGISQARILDWVAISFSRGSSWPRDQTHVSYTGRQTLNCWATWGALRCCIQTVKFSCTSQKNNCPQTNQSITNFHRYQKVFLFHILSTLQLLYIQRITPKY